MESQSEKPLRFLFAIDNLRHGGAQKVLRAILSRFDRERVVHAIWRLGGGSGIESWYEELDIPIVGFPAWQMRTGVGLARMFRRMRRNRPDLVQTFLFHADICGRILARSAGVPAVVSSVRATNLDKSKWQLWLDRRTASMADRIIAVSSATRDFAVAREGAPPDRTVVIPNGIDTEEYAPGQGRDEVRRELGCREGEFLVGAIGRLHPQKGHACLLDAAARLAKSHSRVRFFIAGYGPLEGFLAKRVAEMGLEDRVLLLGYRADAPRLLAAMDAFALPSLWEGMSNALLEAMAMAVPTVATAVDGNVELVRDGETGLLVPPDNPRALADAIAALADAPRRAEAMGRAARERAKREFSLRTCTDRYIDLYENLLSEKAGKPVSGLRKVGNGQ